MAKESPNDSWHNPNSQGGKAFVGFWRKVYNPLGFKKGYNFPLFVILVGAMMGFVLARISYLNYAVGYLPVRNTVTSCYQSITKLTSTPRTPCRARHSGIPLPAPVESESSYISLQFSLPDFLFASNSCLLFDTSYSSSTASMATLYSAFSSPVSQVSS